MQVEKHSDGFHVKFEDSELEVLAWAEQRFGPNEFLSMLQHWIVQRTRDREQIDGKDLKKAFEQLPLEMQQLVREKLDELRFED